MSFRHATQVALACAIGGLLPGCGGEEPANERPSSPFVRSGGPGPATVWAVGDAGHIGHRERDVARLIARGRPDRLLYLGDVYERGTRAEFRGYDRLFGRLAPITAPTPGNHEWPTQREGYGPYWKEKKGREPPLYYSFRLAGWELIGLNSQLFGDDRTRQREWLRRKVAGRGNCRLAFWHEPRYSAGIVHGDEPRTDYLWRSLRGRAALVVNAHEHDMQRMKPRDGIVEVISGAGGHGHRYPVRDGDRRFAFADDDHDGALRIRLSRGRAALAFVAVDGSVLDSSTVRCREA